MSKQLWLIAVLFIAAPVKATIPPAYVKVANDHGIPPAVFYSIMLIESGKSQSKRFRPWPWTLNVELRPHYFATRSEAEAALSAFINDPSKKRIAVGLGQIYLPSHAKHFDNPVVLLDPGTNLAYAARLLAEEYQWTVRRKQPNWWQAVGRYHTPSRPDLALPYARLVYQRCQRISNDCDRFGVRP